jgi:hypothetical protein
MVAQSMLADHLMRRIVLFCFELAVLRPAHWAHARAGSVAAHQC